MAVILVNFESLSLWIPLAITCPFVQTGQGKILTKFIGILRSISSFIIQPHDLDAVSVDERLPPKKRNGLKLGRRLTLHRA